MPNMSGLEAYQRKLAALKEGGLTHAQAVLKLKKAKKPAKKPAKKVTKKSTKKTTKKSTKKATRKSTKKTTKKAKVSRVTVAKNLTKNAKLHLDTHYRVEVLLRDILQRLAVVHSVVKKKQNKTFITQMAKSIKKALTDVHALRKARAYKGNGDLIPVSIHGGKTSDTLYGGSMFDDYEQHGGAHEMDGEGFWSDVWDGIKEVGKFAAPLVPLLL